MAGYRGVTFKAPTTFAGWDPRCIRHFFVDQVKGDDGRMGYVDAMPGEIPDPSDRAVKTFARLWELFPTAAEGHMYAVHVKHAPGQPFATQKIADYPSKHGHGVVTVRGPYTGHGDPNAPVNLSAVLLQHGPGPEGTWTCAKGTEVGLLRIMSWHLHSSPNLVSSRVRFIGNVTAQLQHVTTFVHSYTAREIVLATTLPVTPVEGDRFFIEQPGIPVAK